MLESNEGKTLEPKTMAETFCAWNIANRYPHNFVVSTKDKVKGRIIFTWK
jgi:hypothetical protein